MFRRHCPSQRTAVRKKDDPFSQEVYDANSQAVRIKGCACVWVCVCMCTPQWRLLRNCSFKETMTCPFAAKPSSHFSAFLSKRNDCTRSFGLQVVPKPAVLSSAGRSGSAPECWQSQPSARASPFPLSFHLHHRTARPHRHQNLCYCTLTPKTTPKMHHRWSRLLQCPRRRSLITNR